MKKLMDDAATNLPAYVSHYTALSLCGHLSTIYVQRIINYVNVQRICTPLNHAQCQRTAYLYDT